MSQAEREIGIKGEKPFDKAQHLRYALKRAIENNPADALLLSGGIDSSILAALDPKTPAITVVLEGQGIDLGPAQQVTEYLGTPWYAVEISREQALEDIREIIRLTKSYDPALKNDVPVYEGLKQAAYLSCHTVRTGGGADELFAGYSFLHLETIDFKQWLHDLKPQIRLPSSRIGQVMGLRMTYPYLYGEVLELAQTFDKLDLIALLDLGRPGDYAQLLDPELAKLGTWGKIVLRNAAYGVLPTEIIWRTKTDLEFGSGTEALEGIIENAVTEDEIEEMRQSDKHFWSKYHGKLYLIYKSMGFEPRSPQQGEYGCTWCGGGNPIGRRHCLTCGAFPASEEVTTLFQKQYTDNR